MAEGKRYDLGHGDSSGKYSRMITSPIWHYGIVTDVDDPYNAGRIRVRIYGNPSDGLDDNTQFLGQNVADAIGVTSLVKSIGEVVGSLPLPWCEPLMPKFLNVVPKVGEMVKIVTFDYRNKKIRRQYIGPVIGQQLPSDLKYSEYNDSKLKVENNAYSANWALNAEALDGSWKIYPDKEDIAILGRINTDLILRDTSYYNEITLRSGKIKSDTLTQTVKGKLSPYTLNKKNPSYISINFTQADAFQNSKDPNIIKLNLETDRSHINLVADKVNLISHEGSSKRGFVRSILKGDDILTQIKTEGQNLHPIPYGDVLWEFLSVLRPYIEGHIHKASRREPDGDISKNNLIKWFNDNMGEIKDKTFPDGTKYKEIENCRFLSKGVKTN